MEPFWWVTLDGDVDCLAFYQRHYSRNRYADGRVPKLFVGPGTKRVYRSNPHEPIAALWVWRDFIDDCIDERTGQPQDGINCAIFRNESASRSSGLYSPSRRNR